MEQKGYYERSYVFVVVFVVSIDCCCLLSTVRILLLARPPAAFVAASLAVAREKVLEKISTYSSVR